MSNVVIQLQYRDRAKERREKYGQPEPPLPKRSKRETEPEPVPWVLRLTLFILPFCWLEDRKGIQSLKIFTQGFTFAIPVRNSVSLPSFLHVDVVTLLIVLPEQLPVDRILTLRVFKWAFWWGEF